MFRFATRGGLLKIRKLLAERRAGILDWHYPEAVTQQTLAQFLKEINYFEESNNFVNIGLDKSKLNYDHILVVEKDKSEVPPVESSNENVDKVLDLLSQEVQVLKLDFDDARLNGEGLVDLAITYGIYRDLFSVYNPDREDISFTPDQAKRLNKLIPHYWITDQPFARVKRNQPKEPPLPYFIPALGISAKFVNRTEENDESLKNGSNNLFAHTAYYGNIIPACEAMVKPSITFDGKLLHSVKPEQVVRESNFDNWSEGTVSYANFPENASGYFTLALVNLDYIHSNTNLHWMITNMRPGQREATQIEEVCEYLPVHGIQGFGYSRYVFLAFQHDTKLKLEKINSFAPEKRKFDAGAFMAEHKNANILPIGLSWFQTRWDPSSNRVFHDYLEQKAPVYEHVQAEYERKPEAMYPGRAPFNLYLDHNRSKKSINEQVLLERLKSVDPFDYKDQYVPPRVPPTVHEDGPDVPHWMHNVLLKKRLKLGYWRGLRPASAMLPLNNNADLDHPIRPASSSRKNPPNNPNEYPFAFSRRKAHKDMPTSKPANEHQQVFIQDDHEVHLDKVRKFMEEHEKKGKTVEDSSSKT